MKDPFGLSSVVALLLICGGDDGPAPESGQSRAQVPDETSAPTEELEVEIEVEGWRLVADWRLPSSGGLVPAALLLNRAAGSCIEYVALSEELSHRGIASLRVDLRAHGDSDNLGRFQEPFAENLPLLAETWKDVDAALRWIRRQPRVDAGRIAAVGASYSGESIGEALRRGGVRAAAYVMLSPGSFSDESIAEVDSGGRPWLFIRTVEEGPASRPVMDALFEVLAERSESAVIRVIPGKGHATKILAEHPFIAREITDWLLEELEVVRGEAIRRFR